jgi:RNA 3'-terminal phosphate cyclase (ATP)
MIVVDGRRGEGGGQILRTALAVAVMRGQALRVEHIRAGRPRPGLMRQHLAAVRAVVELSGAEVEGDNIGSTTLELHPRGLRTGALHVAVGSAGSASLVLQTVLPALLSAPAPTSVVVEGGTHNPLAPSFDFLRAAFLPALAALGADVELHLDRHGFAPAGGGRVRLVVRPRPLAPHDWLERGAPVEVSAHVILSQLPPSIARREAEALAEQLGAIGALPRASITTTSVERPVGPGNAVELTARFEHVTEHVTSLGEVRLPAERVVARGVGALAAYLAHGAPVGEHLADQLILPLVLAGGGRFRTGPLSLHAETQAALVAALTETPVHVAPVGDGTYTVQVGG